MSKKFSYYLVKEDGDVEGTNDSEIAEAASKDGSTVVIDTRTGVATFDSEPTDIKTAERGDWLDGDLSDDEGDDE